MPAKLDFLQLSHAQSLISTRGAGYKNILDSSVEAIKANATDAELHEAGISNQADLCSRVDALLKLSRWTNAQDLATRHWYLFAALRKNEDGSIASELGSKTNPLSNLSEEETSSIRNLISTTMLELLSSKNPFLKKDLTDTLERIREKVQLQLQLTSPESAMDPLLKKTAKEITAYYLRLWLAAGGSGPGIVDIMILLGRGVTKRRIIDGQNYYDSDLWDETPATPQAKKSISTA
jgi:hypothetical protein